MKNQFCSINPKWSPFKKQLAKEGLTLTELRTIEDEVLLLLEDDMEDGREEILTFIDDKREVLIHQEISDGISCDVLRMMEIRNTLPPEDWQERILLMKQGTKSAKELRVIEGLEFGFHEPLAHEFNPEAIESTFASRMEQIAKEVRTTHSLGFYEKNLSAAQKKQIEHFVRGEIDPEHIAYAVDAYIRDLRKQIKAAEAFYFGRMKEGLAKLNKLSKEVQERVDSLMVEAVGHCGQTTEAIVSAILHSVEEQMGVHSDAVA
jgi:hypothetical protein